MNNLFYTRQQLKVFAECLPTAFVNSGFEIVEEPYIDYALYGFRATYIRRYMLQKSMPPYDGILTTLIHVVGLPFGRGSQKMVILSAPRNIKNEPISDTIKLRVHFDKNGNPFVVHNENQPTANDEIKSTDINNPFTEFSRNQSNHFNGEQPANHNSRKAQRCKEGDQFFGDLARYVAHILETISPGLIQLPTEMKLEILKKLSVDSIIRMSQVNNEFRSIIFQHGESLWRHLCLRDFNVNVINRLVHRSWMELYRDTYIIHQVEICRKERALPGLPERPALPPVPYRLQIEWLPEVLQLPFYPLNNVAANNNVEHPMQLALEFMPLRRADSLDSIS